MEDFWSAWQLLDWEDLGWYLVYAAWIIGSAVFLLLDRRPPVTTLAWLIGFWGIPWLTVPIYALVGPRKLKQQARRRDQVRQAAAERIPGPGSHLPDGYAGSTHYRELVRVTQVSGEASGPLRQAREITHYESGDSAYPVMQAVVEGARETINLECYVYLPDSVGRHWRDLLAAKAAEGVKVRLLVDAVGATRCKDSFWDPIIDSGGTVKIFNPMKRFLTTAGRLNFRCHRKILVVDGSTAFTGGMNISAHNWSAAGTAAWRNTHMKIEGPPVYELQTVFLIDWLYGQSVREDTRKSEASIDRSRQHFDLPLDASEIDSLFPFLETTQGPWVQIVDSGPDEPSHDIHRLYFAAINAARRRIWMTTPYFVPDQAIQAALTTACTRGVDVQIIVPRKGDITVIDKAALTFAEEVACEGGTIWAYEPRLNHSKTLVVDEELSIVGSANVDNRSFMLNFEIATLILDTGFNDTMAALFEKDVQQSTRLDFNQEDSLCERLLKNSARVLAPLL